MLLMCSQATLGDVDASVQFGPLPQHATMHHSFHGDQFAPGFWDNASHGIYDCLRQSGDFNSPDLTNSGKGQSSMRYAYDGDGVEPDDLTSP
eukprot:2462000-Karenia_brevis.AAC.1